MRRSDDRIAARRVAIQTMLVDLLTAEVVGAFEARGIPSVLMKGPILARSLYADDPERRPYGDSDLLVAPSHERRASEVLEELGFRNEYAAFGHPRIGPQSWLRAPHENVDLHTTLWGVSGDAQEVWRSFWVPGLVQSVGGRLVNVPPVPARALHLGLHAAQHPDAERTEEDLRRGVERYARSDWEAAAELADRLGAGAAFAGGLRRHGGAAGRLASGLGLPEGATGAAAARAASVPLAEGFAQLADTSGLQARVSLLRRELFPTPEFMRWWTPIARRGGRGLAVAYLWRLGWMARRAPAGYRAWRRASGSLPPD